jgi:diaminopimelate decarboxylase
MQPSIVTNFKVDSDMLASCLDALNAQSLASPSRLFLAEAAEQNFAQLSRAVGSHPVLRAAYSVKTNPRDEVIDLALRHGLDVEVISEAERRHVRARGFAPGRILYNGPRPLGEGDVAVAFADSAEAFARNAARSMEVAHGIRLRPSGVSSRFGVEVDAIDEVATMARRSAAVTNLGVSFFIRSQDAGRHAWLGIAREVVADAVLLERLAGKPVTILNLGGGCSPAEFDERWTSVYPPVLDFARDQLRFIERIYIEPGQEVAAPVEAVVARVLEVRRKGRGAEVVIDAGLPAVPHAGKSEHRLFAYDSARWIPLPPGDGRVLGCICMEEDIVKTNVSVAGIEQGDLLAVCDAGAYDSSMAFSFAKGRNEPEAP